MAFQLSKFRFQFALCCPKWEFIALLCQIFQAFLALLDCPIGLFLLVLRIPLLLLQRADLSGELRFDFSGLMRFQRLFAYRAFGLFYLLEQRTPLFQLGDLLDRILLIILSGCQPGLFYLKRLSQLIDALLQSSSLR
jgi:hypothetical protein